MFGCPGGIDGLEATRHIKALLQIAHIPFLAITASIRLEDMHRALVAGCSGFVRKPLDIDELPKQLAEHIARASSYRLIRYSAWNISWNII